MIYRAARYAPHLPNYAAAAGGRVFPSAAGFHTSKTFFTDDEGLYVLEICDAPGPWKDSPKVRSAAQVHDERFKECVTLQAQYIYDSFGKFPGTIPSMFLIMYLQAHHLDLEFYDRFYKPGSYLKTHAMHMAKWHSEESKDKP